METIRMVVSREAVVHKTVLDSYDVDVLDLSGPVNVEVDNQQRVYLNGVMLKGARVYSFEQCDHRFTGIRNSRVCLHTANSVLNLEVNSLVHIDSHVPSSAKLVETSESRT